MFAKYEKVILQTPRKGILTGMILEEDDDGFLLQALNDEIIYLPRNSMLNMRGNSGI